MPESTTLAARRSEPELRSRRIRRGLFVISLVVLLFHVSRFAADNMGLAAMSTAMAIVDRGTLHIDAYAEGLREVSWHDGHYYSGLPPGESFIAVPIYALARPALAPAAHALLPVMRQMPRGPGRLFSTPYQVRRILLLLLVQVLVLIPVAAWATVMAYDLIRLAVGERPGAISLALLLPLGSLWWAHAAGGSVRTVSATLVLTALWWLMTMRDATDPARRPWITLALGAAVGLAIATRYDIMFVALPVGIYALVRTSRRERVALAIGLTAVLGLTGLYHYAAFGSPLRTPYHAKLTPRLHIQHDYRDSTEGLRWLEHAGERMAVYNQAKRDLRPWNVPWGLAGAPAGLLWFTPPLVLSLVGVWLLARRRVRVSRDLALVVFAAAVGNLVAVSLMPYPGYMGSVGPRYLIPSLPFWILLMSPAWVALWRPVRGLLLVVSFVPSYLAAMFTERVDAAFQVGLVGRFGLSNYVMSRAQEAGLGLSPAVSTAVCLAFWVMVALIAVRWGLAEPGANLGATEPEDTSAAR